MNLAAIVWLVLMVVFLAMEASTVSMVSLWFAAGSLIALLTALAGGPAWLQTVLFLAVSAGLLLALRPLAKKYLAPKVTATNVDSIVGSTGLVTAAIDNVSASGQVKLGAMEWTARSTSGQPIPVGTLVKVDKIEGVKAFVSPAEVPANVT
ncbi:MAG: NfeD family protein [Clostridiales bacterium]|nr:NfeD family protein [Clostridiales bacterium]